MTTYSITAFGSLQESPVPFAINKGGIVTGSLNDRPFRYKNYTLIELDTPGFSTSGEAYDISSAHPERIAGLIVIGPANAIHRATLWTDGVYADLGALTGVPLYEAWGVNDSGIVTGVADARGFRLDMKTQQLEMLVPPAGYAVASSSINKSGHVAGCIGYDQAAVSRPFFYDQTMHVITIPGGGNAHFSTHVNDADVMAGSYSTSNGWHAFTYDFKSKVFTDLQGPVFSWGSIAWGINNQGVVVGIGNPEDAGGGAMIWTAADGMRRLIDLVDKSTGWYLGNATGINDAGEITGWGVYYGQQRGFILTPIEDGGDPQPKDLVAMVKEIIFAGGGMGILLPSGEIIYPKDGPVDPDSPLQRMDAARSDAAIGLAMQVLARRISDRSTRALAEKAAVEIALSAAASAGSAGTAAGRSNWLSRLVREIADDLER